MDIDVDSEINIRDPSQDILDFCKTQLTFDNPAFFKADEMGRYTGNIPKQIILYKRIGDELILPYGCLRPISSFIQKSRIARWIMPIRNREYSKENYELRDYQKEPVYRAMYFKNGIIEAPCGSGKTMMGLDIIASVGGRALWITHTSDLLKQSYDRAVSLFGADGMGTVTAGKTDIGERITFATVQTLSRIDLSEVSDFWDVIIVDEAHHCVGTPNNITMFSKVMSYLCAEYKIGLTATPSRTDGLTRCMYAIIGGLFARVKRTDIECELCPVQVNILPYDLHLSASQILKDDTDTVDWNKTINAVIEDEKRNALIVDLAMSLTEPTLVLSGRCAHLDNLQKSCGHGTVLKAGKEKIRDDLMFATYQLMSEGFDYPELQHIIIATPIGNERLITQSVGRLTRKCQTKNVASVYDIQDNHGVFRKMNATRLRTYKKIGCEIKN